LSLRSVPHGHHPLIRTDPHLARERYVCSPRRRPGRQRGHGRTGLPWSLGGLKYGGALNQIFHGFVGDVRIVNRAHPCGSS
jgi:hypothetical protein